MANQLNDNEKNRLDGITKRYHDYDMQQATASTYLFITQSISELISATPSLQESYDISTKPQFILSAENLTIGNSVSYTEFEPDGTMKMIGSASVYEDFAFPLLSGKLIGTSDPTLYAIPPYDCAFKVYGYQFAMNNQISGSSELLHGYKEGSDIEVHIHWTSPSSDDNDKGVKWQFQYAIASPYSFFYGYTTTVDVVIPAMSLVFQHFKNIFDDKISGLDNSGNKFRIGTKIMWVLTRIPTACSGGDPNIDPIGIAVGLHYECDTIGSRLMYLK